MDPNQINQMNNLNQINQMSMYQNYLLNNENKLDSQANMNLLYNYQQYYKGQARNNTNTGAIGINPIQMQNAYLQHTNNATALQTNTALNLGNVYPLSNNNNLTIVDTPNFNKIDGDDDTNTENSVHSQNNLNNQNENAIDESTMNKQIQSGQIKNEDEIDRPWDRASKDPSIIQKGTELFVGNLSLESTEYDLFEAFKDCGEVIDVRIFNLCYIDHLDKSP